MPFFSHFASNFLIFKFISCLNATRHLHKLAFSKVAWTWTFFPAGTGLEITIRKSIEPNYDGFQHQASNAVTGNSRDNICVQLMHQQSSRMNWHLHAGACDIKPGNFHEFETPVKFVMKRAPVLDSLSKSDEKVGKTGEIWPDTHAFILAARRQSHSHTCIL